MINMKFRTLAIIYILFIALITILSASIIIDKIKEISKLEKTNKELKEQNIEYRWELEEVPNIIESNKEEICK